MFLAPVLISCLPLPVLQTTKRRSRATSSSEATESRAGEEEEEEEELGGDGNTLPRAAVGPEGAGLGPAVGIARRRRCRRSMRQPCWGSP